MSDTQWPRFEVFEQEKKGAPHKNANSVHAPDAEMALLNARDIFVRRPDCFSLWVVPADKIFSKTAQELADRGWPTAAQAELGLDSDEVGTPAEPYYVFRKLRQQGRQSYAGVVEARTPIEAMQQALETFTTKKGLVWWVFPTRFVTKSEPDDVESMFAPARDKVFRDQSFYPTVAMMREIKKKAKADKESP